jgi:cation:H+ antiporter
MLKLSQFITGFVILGIATSTPEIFIGISSAVSGVPQLSLANLIGANLVLLTLIAGFAAILGNGVNVKHELGHWGRIIQVGFLIVSPLIVLADGRLTRLDALFLSILYIGYTIYLYHSAPKDSPPLSKELMNHSFRHNILLMFVGLIGLMLSSRAIVYAALQLASGLQVSSVLIGTVILAVGTNLPEIAVVWAAIRHHHPNLVIGDVLGSAATNTLVIALLGFISPFVITDRPLFETSAIFMIAGVLLFFALTKTKNYLSFFEGGILVGLYIASVITEIWISSLTHV